MHLSTEQVRALSESTFRRFLESQIPEGTHIDYKRQLDDAKGDEWKRELLKDATGFANAEGGHIVYGVLEPREGIATNQQIIGISSHTDVAQRIERVLAACIDSRVSGLVVLPVLIAGKGCVFVHIPPSYSKPHMVISGSHRGFYIRHSESTMSMSTFEIRESVLSTANAEQRAESISSETADVIMRAVDKPCFVMQAVPLIKPSVPWPVMGKTFDSVARGTDARREFADPFNLCSGRAPIANIHGLVANSGELMNCEWSFQLRRTGHVLCSFSFDPLTLGDAPAAPLISATTFDLFRAFTVLVEEADKCADSDLTYLFRADFFCAHGAIFLRREGHFSAPLILHQASLQWPPQVRLPGRSYTEIAEQWALEFSNAFGSRTLLN